MNQKTKSISRKDQTKPSTIAHKQTPLTDHRHYQANTIQYNTIQYNTIQYNTIQYNTIQLIHSIYCTPIYSDHNNPSTAKSSPRLCCDSADTITRFNYLLNDVVACDNTDKQNRTERKRSRYRTVLEIKSQCWGRIHHQQQQQQQQKQQ
jgi:hypothetical protein